MELKAKVWVERRGRFVLGDGGVALLEMVDRTGSIQGAARRLGWSYRHTWGYLRNLEEASGRTFVTRRHGGAAGGGAEGGRRRRGQEPERRREPCPPRPSRPHGPRRVPPIWSAIHIESPKHTLTGC